MGYGFRPVIWSPVEIEYLKKNKTVPINQLCIALSKSIAAVKKKKRELETGVVDTVSRSKTGAKIGKRKDCNNIFFIKGLFSDTLHQIENKTFCFVHIDADIYSSVLECCDFFYTRLVNGGIMVFDDYGFLSCPGAKKAVDQFFQDKIESPIYLETGQAIVQRIVN